MNPWIDACDLRLTYDNVYQWRDTTVFVRINEETNEIMDIWEE